MMMMLYQTFSMIACMKLIFDVSCVLLLYLILIVDYGELQITNFKFVPDFFRISSESIIVLKDLFMIINKK